MWGKGTSLACELSHQVQRELRLWGGTVGITVEREDKGLDRSGDKEV